MTTITQAVNLIEEKLNSLLENYTFLKEENELLYSKITILEHQKAKDEQLFNVNVLKSLPENHMKSGLAEVIKYGLIKDEQLFNEIEKKYQTLKIAKTLEGSKEDRRETKLKINALIREVDACINQLSE